MNLTDAGLRSSRPGACLGKILLAVGMLTALSQVCGTVTELPTALPPNVFLAVSVCWLVVTASVLHQRSRRAETNAATAVFHMLDGSTPAPEDAPHGLLTFTPRGPRALRLKPLTMSPRWAVWIGPHLVAACGAHQHIPGADSSCNCGIRTFTSVDDLQRHKPTAHTVVMTVRHHSPSRPAGEDDSDGRLSAMVTPVAVWTRPGTPTNTLMPQWIAHHAPDVAEYHSLDKMIADHDGLSPGEPVPLGRSLLYAQTHRTAHTTAHQRTLRRAVLAAAITTALLLVSGAGGLVFSWWAWGTDQTIPSIWVIAAVSAVLIGAGGGLRRLTRRWDDHYGELLRKA